MLCLVLTANGQSGIPSEAISAFEKAYGEGSFGKRYIIFSIDSAKVRRGWENVGTAIEQLIDKVKPVEHFDMDGDNLKDLCITFLDVSSRGLTCPTVVFCKQQNGEYSICTPPLSNGYGACFTRKLGSKGIEWLYLQEVNDEKQYGRFEYRSDTIFKKNGYWTKASSRPIDKSVVSLEYWVTSGWEPQPSYLFTFKKVKAPMLEIRQAANWPNPIKEKEGLYTMAADSGYARLIWQMIGMLNEHDLLDMSSGGADRRKANLVFHFVDGSSKSITDYGMDNNLTLVAFYDLVNKMPKTQWKIVGEAKPADDKGQ
jgi:hypothetical protein